MRSTTVGATAPSTDRTTRLMLAGGVATGPFYVLVAALQALTRPGFDIERHPVSLLSNGELGWIQISNFIVAGVLCVLAAIGAGRVLGARPGGTWGPRLLAVYGVSVVAAGILVADPALGFPVGVPDGPPAEVSWPGLGHFVAGGVGFTALVGACLVFARHPVGPGWAVYSVTTGGVVLVTFAAVASGSGAGWVNLAFTAGVILGWTWISASAVRILSVLRTATTREAGAAL